MWWQQEETEQSVFCMLLPYTGEGKHAPSAHANINTGCHDLVRCPHKGSERTCQPRPAPPVFAGRHGRRGVGAKQGARVGLLPCLPSTYHVNTNQQNLLAQPRARTRRDATAFDRCGAAAPSGGLCPSFECQRTDKTRRCWQLEASTPRLRRKPKQWSPSAPKHTPVSPRFQKRSAYLIYAEKPDKSPDKLNPPSLPQKTRSPGVLETRAGR